MVSKEAMGFLLPPPRKSARHASRLIHQPQIVDKPRTARPRPATPAAWAPASGAAAPTPSPTAGNSERDRAIRSPIPAKSTKHPTSLRGNRSLVQDGFRI